MTTREVDEKIASHRDSLKRLGTEEQPKSSKTSIQPSSYTAAKSNMSDSEELQCPLALWKCIVHVTTTRTIGNQKVDQNNLSINFANIRQKSGESISDFKRRMINLLDSFDAIKLDRPSDGLIATRFLHGLEDSRYALLKMSLGNELANGRDLYQRDLDGAASQATRWLVHGNKTSNSLPTPPVVNSFNADKGTSKKQRKRQEKQTKVEEPVQHSDETCDFCKRKGHSQAECFKYAAASKAAVEEAAAKEKHFKRALCDRVRFLHGSETEVYRVWGHPQYPLSGYGRIPSVSPHLHLLDYFRSTTC